MNATDPTPTPADPTPPPSAPLLTWAQVQDRINRVRRLWDRAWDEKNYPVAFRCKDLYLSLLARSEVPDEADAAARWKAEAKAEAEMN